jgi:hypothetical protein
MPHHAAGLVRRERRQLAEEVGSDRRLGRDPERRQASGRAVSADDGTMSAGDATIALGRGETEEPW